MAAGLFVNVKSNFAEINADIKRLSEGQIRSATARALNRAGKTARKEAVEELKDRFGLKTRSLTKRIRQTTATRAQLATVLKAFDYDPALSSLSPKWSRKPLTPGGASIKLPGGGRFTVLGSFVAATTRGGKPLSFGGVPAVGPGNKSGIGVYIRTGGTYKGGRTRSRYQERQGKSGHGYPIKFLRASDIGLPTLVKAFLEPPVVRRMRETAERRFSEEFEREIRARAAGFVPSRRS